MDDLKRHKRVIEVIREALRTPDLPTDGARLSVISAVVHSLDPVTEEEIRQAKEIAKKLESEGVLKRALARRAEAHNA